MHKTPYIKLSKYMETAKKNLAKKVPAVTRQLPSSNPALRCIYYTEICSENLQNRRFLSQQI